MCFRGVQLCCLETEKNRTNKQKANNKNDTVTKKIQKILYFKNNVKHKATGGVAARKRNSRWRTKGWGNKEKQSCRISGGRGTGRGRSGITK